MIDSTASPFKQVLERSLSSRGGLGYSILWAIWVCAAPKGMVFEPFWSEIEYVFHSGLASGILFTWHYFFSASTLANL